VKKPHFAIVVVLTALLGSAQAEESGSTEIISAQQPAGTLSVSLRNEVDAAIDRGLDWLAEHQKKDGSWSNASFPALTALPLQAFTGSHHPNRQAVIDKAVAFILSCARKDGGIYRQIPDRKGGGLGNYNTAICMTALHAAEKPSLFPVVQRARKYLAGGQHFGGDVYRGGFGYDRDTDRSYTDLLNTYYAVVAMRETQSVEDLRGKDEKQVDINWAETVKYIEKLQNKPKAGKDDAGGFFYNPGESKAGTVTNKAGVVVFRSYGSITYAGLLALVYANVSRDDVRIQSAFDWSARHWSLKENPGMGTQGMYFFYNVLAKSLDTYGQDLIPRPDKQLVDWRTELARKVVALQKIDPKTGHGYWVNDTGRFWENDPVLSTAYALLALERL